MAYLFYIISIIAVEDLVTQGAMASETVILTSVNWINSFPAR